MTASPKWQFWVDRGGTFTDCLGISPEGAVRTTKVLSSDRAPLEAIAKLAAEFDAGPLETLDADVKLGTTVATNALLERRGVPTAILTTAGLSGVFDIGTQERPELFVLEIERPVRLQQWRLETPGRRAATGEVVEALDLEHARGALAAAREEGALALAIVCMHAHIRPDDEIRLAEVARAVGFEHVVCSHEMSREIGFLARGETAIADAYLTPLLRGHAERLAAGLPAATLRFMQSSGGLTEAASFRGPNALLSGPAGGVVAARSVAKVAKYAKAIGFDMGGTSTDVSLISGEHLDRAFESEVGGVRVKAPMLRIHTVAAGGGSLCRFDGIRLTVGPESAGSDPGPLCYALRSESHDGATQGELKAHELAITDINFALGRVVADRFPFPLEREPVVAGLERIRGELSEAGFERSDDEIAAGFFEIANASMAQAILEVSVERGADPRDHVLVGFGGAGGQHVCALAERLGIEEILIHPHAGLLSAYGIGIAPASWDGQRHGRGRILPARGSFEKALIDEWRALEAEGRSSMSGDNRGAKGSESGSAGPSAPSSGTKLPLKIKRSLDLGYRGTDTALNIVAAKASDTILEWRALFEAEHRARFGYIRPDREIEIKAVRLRAVSAEAEAPPIEVSITEEAPDPLRMQEAWFPRVGRVTAPIYERESLGVGDRLAGPALILESTGTVVLDPGFELEVDSRGVFRIQAFEAGHADVVSDLTQADPVRLEVLGNRFMSIAEQMGAVLRNTAVSTNIKERLDYSCAVFDRDGSLVANAPHIPVHLGAMADTVEAMRHRFIPMSPGDVFVTNDPFEGGSHLPDVTVVTPVFIGGQYRPSFFVGSRGHHADMGGKTPGSMPADSTTLAEEGVLIEAFPLVSGDRFEEARIREVLGAGPHPARQPDDNVADLEAMVAANRAGNDLLTTLVEESGEEVVQVTMAQLQAAAAAKVSRELARLDAGRHHFEDALDDGTPICVTLEISHHETPTATDLPARMTIDFAGTGPASAGNLNAPAAVVHAAVIYVLRSLVAERIPLNGGCLNPVEVRIPEGSILDPPKGSAVVGGNVETSQRVVDVLLGALGRAAASQGTMNNVSFGDDSFGYYETIGGGAGATAFAAGASAVHTHMTNTRITDPEVLEARFPVRLLEFAIREGTGGLGMHKGGDGIRRRYAFLQPVAVSLLSERRALSPFGLAGGEPGAAGLNRVHRSDSGDIEDVSGSASLSLGTGDELWIETPGGGAFGSIAASDGEVD